MNPYGKKNIAGTVWEIAEPVAAELGYSIWNVEYVREGADMYLRITIDSEEGIDLDDCERMTRSIDPLLDEADPIEDAYYLEVSSPGVERVLVTDEHFEIMAGSEVEVKLYRALNGSKTVRGVLAGKADGVNNVTTAEGDVQLDEKACAKVTTVFDWQSAMNK